MNIKRLGLWIIAFLMTSRLLAVAPTAISNLQAVTGTTLGSVDLTWTAPDQAGASVSEYLVRYRPNNAIMSQTSFNSSTIWPRPPSPPLTPGASEYVSVTGLTPGVSYYFCVVSRGTDTANLFSPLSNSPFARAMESCPAGPFDGEGSATVLTTPLPVGPPVNLSLRFTPGSNGILPGGKFGFRVPTSWPSPNNTSSTLPGFVSFSAPGNGATLTMTIDGNNVLFTVTGSTALNQSYPVDVQYNNVSIPCQTNVSSHTFLFASQYESCGQLVSLGAPAVLNVLPGDPDYVGFDLQTLPVVVGSTVSVNLKVRDFCYNEVALTTATTVTIRPQKFSGTTYTYDPDVVVSTKPDLSSPFLLTGGNIPFEIGKSSKTFYYLLNNNSGNPTRRIESEHPNFHGAPYPFFNYVYISAFSGGITGLSVDTGVLVPNQTSVSFTPDGDNIADVAFINFQMPTNLAYTVQLSSNNFSTIARTFYGYGTTARISWYGDSDNFSATGPDYVPPGTYAVRVADYSNTLSNQSLSITVVAGGITGIVRDSSNSQPVANAEIRMQQNNIYRFGRSDSTGRFTMFGLKPGSFQVRVERPGYLANDFNVTISSGLLNYGVVSLNPAATLKLHFTRAASTTTTLPEVWGNLRANTTNWSSQSYATVHFAQGQTDSDAGDFWSTIPSSYSVLNLNPGIQYTISLEINGYGMTPFTRTITGTQEETISLAPRPDISGRVLVPAGSNPNGMWISVEACIDAVAPSQVCDSQDPSQRFYGGTYLVPGSSEGVHMVPGVTNGTFLLTARGPGFVNSKINVTVTGGVSVTNADFPVLSQGGSLTGTITVNGDTGSLDSGDGTVDGFFRLPINCWSATTYQGSFTEVILATSPTQSTATYTLSGLEDGTYQIFINLQGFEVTPPGQITATVTSGNGTRNITLQEFTGSLTGLVTLPGGGNFNNVSIDLLPSNQGFTTNSNIITVTPNGGGNYSITKLGTGYYTLRAIYTTTGYITEKSVSIANGQAAQKNLDLSGNTYTLSGTVATNASSPFNALSYLVNSSTPTSMYNQATSQMVSIAANRIVAERLRDNEYYGDPNSGGGANGIPYDPKKLFFGFYDASGQYTIPNLSPGVYRVYNNGELDNITTNGSEIAKLSEIIHISGNLTKDFNLIDGYDISGTIVVDSGVPESGRDMDLQLRTSQDLTVASKRVSLVGTSASFQIDNVPNGSYLLSLRDNSSPTKYVARNVLVEVNGANVTGKLISLKNPARITGTLRIATSGELLTNQNYSQFLTNEFRIEARSNPWAQGKYGFANYPLIDTNNKFTVAVLDGSYDLMLRTDGFIGEAAIAQGKKQFIDKTVSGISVVEGQTLDLGVLDLEEGLQIRGTISDTSSAPLPNILVNAYPAGQRRFDNTLSATSNQLGQFVIYGADPGLLYSVKAAPRPEIDDRRFLNYEGSLYGESLRKNVRPGSAPIAFQLSLAPGIVRGTVVAADNGTLLTPFDETPEPGAQIIMNKVGNTPENNPLGDIEIITNPDGTFEVKGLVNGTYNLYALASGYANGISRNIQVGSTAIDIGTVTLSSGATLSGTLSKPDNSLPNSNEINGLLAVRAGFEELIIAKLNEDASGNITGYSISGFQPNRTYDIIYFDDNDEISVLTSGIVVNEDSQLNFVLATNQSPRAITQAKKNQDGTITLKYEFTKPLRNSQIDLDNDLEADDNELDERFTLVGGAGSLAIAVDALSSDRKRFRAIYTPDPSDTSFVIRADLTFNALDTSNEYYTLTQNVTFYLGIGARASEVITNLNGGSVELDDGSEFTTQSGTFGDETDDSVEVTMSAADNSSEFAGANPRVSKAMAVANTLGLRAYPVEMASAMSKARATSISPFSSFYDIFLPAGVSHFFPEGSEASLCLNYDDSVSDTDAYSMNIYYFNEATNEYVLEQTNKTVDTENNLICASIAHASVFTVLNSSVPILTGAGYTGELAIINFPNPFSLKQKSVTLQDPGALTAAQTIDGTMIKMSIPTTMAGSIEIQIFNVAGEKVRTLNSEVSGGAHYYLQWDGRNDHGEKVASGTYIARFTIGGANERFFKMAVLK